MCGLKDWDDDDDEDSDSDNQNNSNIRMTVCSGSEWVSEMEKSKGEGGTIQWKCSDTDEPFRQECHTEFIGLC